MSLIEVLVAMVILAIGMFAIVRLLIPGLGILPSQAMRQSAVNMAQTTAQDFRDGQELRPDAICSALPVDAAVLSAGYALLHDVSSRDPYQWSYQVSTVTGVRSFVPPTLVVGERFLAPVADPARPAHIVAYGPVRPGSGWVYDPIPVRQAGNLLEALPPGVDTQYIVADWTAGSIEIMGPPTIGVANFRACYSYIDAGRIVDIIGEAFTPIDSGTGTFLWSAGRDMVRGSLTVYSEVSGASLDENVPSMGGSDYSVGIVRLPTQTVPAGSTLAVTYETQTHYRAGFDFSLTDPRDPDNPVQDYYMPDILLHDDLVPTTTDLVDASQPFDAVLNPDVKKVQLPLEFLSEIPLVDDPTYTHIPEPVIAVSKLDGSVMTVGSGIEFVDYHSGVVGFDATLPDVPIPVRIFYRARGGWSREVDLAPAEFAQLRQDGQGYYFEPASSPKGIKQFWYYFNPSVLSNGVADKDDILQFYGVNFVDAAPDPDIEGGMQDDGGHTVLVDYTYRDAAGVYRKVDAESHVIGVETHKVELMGDDIDNDAQPLFDLADPRQGIWSVRGVTLKSRMCWEEEYERRYEDVDTAGVRS